MATALPLFPMAWRENRWASHLAALGAAVLMLSLVVARDLRDMAHMWWNISTYGHCLFIVPITAWLVMQRKDELRAFAPQGWWPGLVLVLGAAIVWTVGEAAGVALFRHASAILMVQALIITILGKQLSRALLFPIFYLIFLIPAGEELVPTLQTLTAKLTIAMLGLSNVPHQVNGVFITIPGGYFEVAEECSGVKFLIAMVAYGALVANVCFHSWWRRSAFVAVSIIVPILANGVRAFGTIYAAWMVDRDFAKGVDHVIYGWFFFAIVIALVMAIGWRFFDRKVSDPWLADLKPEPFITGKQPFMIAVAALCVLAAPIVMQSAVTEAGRVPLFRTIALPDVPGWQRTAIRHSYPWTPSYVGADHRLLGEYRNAAGDQVTLAVAVYAWQDEGRELVGYGQGAIDPASRWAWASETAKPLAGKAERITAPGPVNREVVSVYWIDGKVTGSASAVKLATLKTRLIGGDQAAAAILISAEERPGQPARAAIDAFMAAMGPADRLAAQLVATARQR